MKPKTATLNVTLAKMINLFKIYEDINTNTKMSENIFVLKEFSKLKKKSAHQRELKRKYNKAWKIQNKIDCNAFLSFIFFFQQNPYRIN